MFALLFTSFLFTPTFLFTGPASDGPYGARAPAKDATRLDKILYLMGISDTEIEILAEPEAEGAPPITSMQLP